MRDAKKHLHGGNFVKKADLKRDGPLRFVVAVVDEVEGKSWDGNPPESEVQLVTTEGARISLRTGANLRRMIAFFGHDLDAWVGAEVEAYFSPDIANPKNPDDSGGLRLRLPTSETEALPAFISDLEDAEEDPGPPPPPPPKSNGPVSRTRQARR